MGTWNLDRGLAAGAEGGARTQEQGVWALLDWMVAAGITAMGLQEVGVSGDGAAQGAVRKHVRTWSVSRRRQAGVWLNSRPDKRHTKPGAYAGVAVVVVGEWAARVQAVRRWNSGRAVSVEMVLANGKVVWVMSAYAPVGMSAEEQAQRRKFLTQMQDEMEEADKRGVSRKLLMMDGNYWEAPLDHESGAEGWSHGAEWREEMALADAWRTRHDTVAGFTRQRQGNASSRLDYVLLESEHEEAVEEAWVGPQNGEVAGIHSDHRPLVVQLSVAAWTGEENVVRSTVPEPTPTPQFVPRHWVAASDEEHAEVMRVARASKRKPTKVTWEEVREAQGAEPVREELRRCRALASQAEEDEAAGRAVQGTMDAAERHWQRAGEMVRDLVKAKMHQSAARGCERKGGGMECGQAYRRMLSVRRWGRLMTRKGWEMQGLTPEELAARWPTCTDTSRPTEVPARMQVLWGEAGVWVAAVEAAGDAAAGRTAAAGEEGGRDSAGRTEPDGRQRARERGGAGSESWQRAS